MIPRIVADLGNTRLKFGRLDAEGRIADAVAAATEEPAAWGRAIDSWGLREARSVWAFASVNPPVATRFLEWLATAADAEVRLYRSARDIPVAHRLVEPQTAGVDRALAVRAALARRAGPGPGHVVCCGTAITVERIDRDRIWDGGAIAPGLGLASSALHDRTAQLPEVGLSSTIPPGWGRSTRPALESGLFWGAVGAVRELLARQRDATDPDPWVVWTGGDAERLAAGLDLANSVVVPNLVLEGLASVAFASSRS